MHATLPCARVDQLYPTKGVVRQARVLQKQARVRQHTLQTNGQRLLHLQNDEVYGSHSMLRLAEVLVCGCVQDKRVVAPCPVPVGVQRVSVL